MTLAPTRFCIVPTCPNQTDGGPCPEHAAQQEHQRFNYAWRRQYRRLRWKRLRQAVLFHEPFCADCAAEGFVQASAEVHHKVRPQTEAQFYDRDNLMALCQPCHSKRTARGE